MDSNQIRYAWIEQQLITWAEGCPDVNAAVVMGSRARLDHPADEWSDMDVILFSHDRELYQNHTDWLDQIAPVWLSIPGCALSGDMERLVLFEGGLQVDLVFVPIASLRRAAENGVIPDPYRRGARAIVDKEGLAAKLIPAVFTKPTPTPLPTQKEYIATVELFWFGVYYLARMIRRGDLLMVQFRHKQVVELLFRMIEWHAKATRGAELDTWHMARFIEDWADPRVLVALRGVFAHYDTADAWCALWNTVALFTWLAKETGERLPFTYSASAESHLRLLLTQLAAGQDA